MCEYLVSNLYFDLDYFADASWKSNGSREVSNIALNSKLRDKLKELVVLLYDN